MLQRKWEEFTTDSVLASIRARRWAEYGSQTLSEMTVDPLNASSFRARISRRDLGPMGFIFLESTPALARSSARKCGSWAGAGNDSLVMTVADKGHCKLSQSNWSAELATGDIAIRDLTKPWESYSAENLGLILIKIPFSSVAQHHPDPEQLVGKHLSVSDPRISFASSVIRASWQAMQADPEAIWHSHLSDVLADVFRMICQGDAGHDLYEKSRTGTSIKRNAMAFIARNMTDPDLSVSAVAAALGISSRHLQRAFLDTGTTPRQFIREERLSAAAKRLSQAADNSQQRIIDIAFEVGFNDASHFSRAFSKKFGCSPRQFRRNPLI